MNFFKQLARGAERGVPAYLAGQKAKQEREDRLAREKEARDQYEAQLVRQRIMAGIQIAQNSGDPDAIASAIQKGVDEGVLPSTPNRPSISSPKDAGTGTVDERTIIPGTETTVTSTSPYADMDPLARGSAQSAAREQLRKDEEWRMRQAEAQRKAAEDDKWTVLGDGVLFMNVPDGQGGFKPVFNVDGQVDKVTSYDKETGIVTWDIAGPRLVTDPNIINRIDEVRKAKVQERISIEEVKQAARSALVNERQLARTNEQTARAYTGAFKQAVKDLQSDSNPLPLDDVISNFEAVMAAYPDVGELIQTAKVALNNQYNPLKLGFSDAQQKDLAGIRTSQYYADRLISQLDNKEIQDILGPLQGRLANIGSILSGGGSYTDKQKQFLTSLSRLMDNARREATGAAISMKEQDFYQNLIGDQYMTPETLKAALSTLIDDLNSDVQAVYETGIFSRYGELDATAIEAMNKHVIFRPSYRESEPNFNLDLDDESLFVEEGPPTPSDDQVYDKSFDSIANRIVPRKNNRPPLLQQR